METGPPSARLGSWRPWRHCSAVVPPAILILGHRNRVTVSGSAEDVVPVVVGVTLGRVIGLGIVAYQIGWSLHPDFSFAGGCDSFHVADPSLPVLNPLPICATAPALGLYHHIANAPRRLKPSGVFGPTLLPVRTFPPLLGAPYLPAASAFSPSTLIPEKIPWSRSVHALLNTPRTFPSFESQSNHSFVGVPHGGCQL